MRADDAVVGALGRAAGLADTVVASPSAGARRRGRDRARATSHTWVPQVRTPQRRATARANARSGASRAAASRSRAAPIPTSRARRVVGGVRVVEVGPGTDPRQQPVEGLLQRAAPAGRVERLDPDARRGRRGGRARSGACVAVMVGAGRAEPAVGAQVVAVEALRTPTGSPVARAVSAGRTPHSRPWRSCHSCSGRKNASSASAPRTWWKSRRTARAASPRSSQRAAERGIEVVAGDPAKRSAKSGDQRRHRRQLVLEGADDHRAEVLPRRAARTAPCTDPMQLRRRPRRRSSRSRARPCRRASAGRGRRAATRRPPSARIGDGPYRPSPSTNAAPRRGAPAAGHRPRQLAVDVDHRPARAAGPAHSGCAPTTCAWRLAPREADLVVEPDATPRAPAASRQTPSKSSHQRSDKNGGSSARLADSGPVGAQVHDDEVPDAARDEPLHLPAQPLRVEASRRSTTRGARARTRATAPRTDPTAPPPCGPTLARPVAASLQGNPHFRPGFT